MLNLRLMTVLNQDLSQTKALTLIHSAEAKIIRTYGSVIELVLLVIGYKHTVILLIVSFNYLC